MTSTNSSSASVSTAAATTTAAAVSDGANRDDRTCRVCGKPGHLAKQCKACRNCGKDGHVSKACPDPKKPPTCRNCQEVGHIERDCKEPKTVQGPRGSKFRDAQQTTYNVYVGGAPVAPVAPVVSVPVQDAAPQAAPVAAPPAVTPAVQAAPAPVAGSDDVIVESGDDRIDANVPFIARSCYGDVLITAGDQLANERASQKRNRLLSFMCFFFVLFAAIAAVAFPIMTVEVPIVKEYSPNDFRFEPMDVEMDGVTGWLQEAFDASLVGQSADVLNNAWAQWSTQHMKKADQLFGRDVSINKDPTFKVGFIAFVVLLLLSSLPLFAVMLSYYAPRPDYKHWKLLGSVFTARKWQKDRRHTTFKTVPVDSDDFEPDAKYLAYRLTECVGGIVTSDIKYVSYEMLIALRSHRHQKRFTKLADMADAFDLTMAFAATQTQININRELESHDIIANTCRLSVAQLLITRFKTGDLNCVRL